MEGKWILTNLDDETKAMLDIPEDDDDILGDANKEAEGSTKPPDALPASKVVDMTYYESLEINADAEQAKIKRQYYLLARKYHPDRVGKDNKEAADKFKDIAEAYQVLSDPELREKYNKEGKEGLSADRTGVAAGPAKVDPALLFAFLFGSDKFGDYTGRLSTATSALVADSERIGAVEARVVQKRRVTRLALKLAERLQIWTTEDYDGAKAIWESAATDLSEASYGTELVHLIGKIYSLSAHQFLGSVDSGVGLPSIAKWAKGQYSKMEESSDKSKAKRDGLMAGVKMMTLQQKLAQEMSEAKTDEERKAKQEELEEEMAKGMLNVMWTTTVVDITTTLHEVIQMVLFDQSVDKDTRKRRGYGLKHLGEIFMACPSPLESGQPEDAKKLYEEAAFAAMLETVKRKEEEAQAARAQ
jgi:curved DNA-binding protein CbpA